MFFQVPILYYWVLQVCFFKTPENNSVPKLAILSAQKSFSRNVIFNKFQMEKELKILQDSRSMLAYFARTLNDSQRTFNRLENA